MIAFIIRKDTKKTMIKLGCHVGNSGNEMLIGSVNEALSYNANCFMLYLGAPQNSFRKPLSEMHIDEYQNIMKEHNIKNEDVIVHCAYILNLANPNVEKREYAINFIINELTGTYKIGAKYLVLHPGAHMNQGAYAGCDLIVEGLKTILEKTKDQDSIICIETMAGKGSECCSTFEEVKYILDKVDNNRVKVCLDTCHIWDAGYDIVNDYENVIKKLDETIGINNIKVIHLNDSKNVCGSHKDRHENIGFGNIGFETLHKVLIDDRFKNVVKILETPYVEGDKKIKYPPYKYEIEMLKNGVFDNNLIDKIKNAD